jgi:Peptidase family S41
MFKNCFFIISIIFLTGGCTQKTTYNPAQNNIAQSKAKQDIETVKQILKTAQPSLYLYISEKRFDFIADSIKNSILENIPLSDLYNKLYFLINETGCNHTYANLPVYIYDTLQNRKFFFPYSLKWIEGKLLVNSYGYRLAQGTQINKINGMDAGKLLNTFMLYNPVEGRHRSGQQLLAAEDFSFDYFLQYGPQQNFALTITDTNNNINIINTEPVTLSEWNDRDYNYRYYYDRVGVDYDLFFNEDKSFAVMRIVTFMFDDAEKREAFENFCSNSFQLLAAKHNIKNLIIDVRENTGGNLNNCFLLFSYLTAKPFTEYEKVVSKIKNIPYEDMLDADFAADKLEDVNSKLKEEFTSSNSKNYYLLADSFNYKWQPSPYRFKGNIFVITNAKVASAASYFSLMVKNSGTGKIVGDETSGGSSSGNGFAILQYVLPNSKIKLFLPYAHIIYTYKENENKGRGVLPNYFVPDTYLSFKENNDRQIKFITDSLLKNQK